MRMSLAGDRFYAVALLSVLVLCSLAFTLRGQSARLGARIDDSQRTQLSGRVPRRAQPQYDRGAIEPSFVIDYVERCY